MSHDSAYQYDCISKNQLYIWQVFDHRIGNQNQINALNSIVTPFLSDFQTHRKSFNIRKSRLSQWFPAGMMIPKQIIPFIKPDLDLAPDDLASLDIPSDAHHLIISAGGRSASVARWFRKHYVPTAKLVQILNPYYGLDDFDLIIVPRHDQLSGDNIISIMGSLAQFCREADTTRELQQSITKDVVAMNVLISLGGNNKYYKMTLRSIWHILKLIHNHDQIELDPNLTIGQYWITTSRRTPLVIEKILDYRMNHLKNPNRFQYINMNKIGAGDINPYFQWLATADRIIVTTDSINMVSEALLSGCDVFVSQLDLKLSFTTWWGMKKINKFSRYIHDLLDHKWVQPLDSSQFYQQKKCSHSNLQQVIRDQNQQIGQKIRSWFADLNF